MATILVADDSIVAQKAYKQMLEFLGHTAVICSDGRQAVDTFRENPADLVILDVDMPEMNGFDACRGIRRLQDGVNVPIIMVSVEDSEEDISNGLNAGANDYMIKPVKEAHLIAKLKTFLKFASIHKSDLDLVRNRVEIAGKYEIEKILGYGAHSVVYRAKDKTSGTDVAIKLINTPSIDDFAKNFIETASKLKELASANVLRIFDYGQFAGKFYVVLEYADGGDLAAIIKKRRLSEAEAVNLAIDLVKGLKDLAGKGIIHFDIKPENIMRCGGVYKLGDFGVISPRESGTIPVRMEIWSTAAYLPPEYLNDTGFVDTRSDIYSTGITLYQSITGDNPFQSEKSAVSMFKQINLVPPTLKTFDSKISPYFSELVCGMMEKDPDKRPKLEDIEHILSHIKEYCELPKAATAVACQIKKELDSLSHKTKSEVPTSKTPEPSMFRLPSFKIGITKATAIFIVVFLVSTAAGIFIYNDLLDNPEISPPGALSAVLCQNCKKAYDATVVNIEAMKCSSCGGHLSYRQKCDDCGFEFPFRQPVLKGDETVKESVEKDLELNKCPKCNSLHTSAVRPSTGAEQINPHK